MTGLQRSFSDPMKRANSVAVLPTEIAASDSNSFQAAGSLTARAAAAVRADVGQASMEETAGCATEA
ncbi:hypothetical protein [Variovorax sp. J22R115]|uniref:hypothetical protein n=1 Tax=Variovorax sp. J22R115 TaxID=3053509 RepID=UPI0025784C22|nr:hypothetical protein [Variovorax sp. J22R115]MDM0047404.1 hypothetical protein [Variovorax sp. J22R115]